MAAVRMHPLALPLLLAALAVLTTQFGVLGQMGDPFADWSPDGVGAVRGDIPFIKCQVCQKVAHELTARLAHKKKMAPKSKPVGELQIIELTEKICDRKSADGGWILRQDMEEDGDKIKLVEYDFDGECANECRTVQRACEEVMGDRDTEIAELLQIKGLDEEQLEQQLCHEMTTSCAEAPPPVPEDRKPGEKFEKPKPKDYGKMAEDMGIQQSVMHNSQGEYEIPEGMPRMPAPKHLQEKSKQKKKKNKKKGRSSRDSSWESMSEL